MADFLINLPAQGPPGIPGTPGADGEPGDVGPRGPAIAVRWSHALYDPAGPIVGQMMLDLSHGQLLFERHDATGANVAAWLTAMGQSTNPAIKGYLMAVEVRDDSQWMLFNVINSSNEYVPGKYSIPVTLNSGSVGIFDEGAEIALNFARAGDKGFDGAGGNMFGANNLTELTNKPSAFDLIKQPATQTYAGVGLFLPNYLTGLAIANVASGDTLHDLTVSPGMATDNGNAVLMRLASAITKQLDNPWVVGDGVGGMDVGGAAAQIAAAWYHVYLIRRPDTGVVDACFSIGNNGPVFGANIPAAYTQYRRLGAVKTDGSKNLTKFYQYNDYFFPQSETGEYSGTIPYASFLITCAGLPTLLVPPIGIFHMAALANSGETTTMGLGDPRFPACGATNVYQGNLSGGLVYGSSEILARVDSSARVRAQCFNGDRYGIVYSHGWIDNRDK